MIKITLINSGQSFQQFICDDTGKIIDVQPKQDTPSIWIGSLIPVNDPDLMQEGKYCPIKKAYSSSYGYLRHVIQEIKYI
jgi:hypothetical protein